VVVTELHAAETASPNGDTLASSIGLERSGLGYRRAFSGGVELAISRLRTSRGHLAGELAARQIQPDRPPNLICRIEVNLTTARGRKDAAAYIGERGGRLFADDRPHWLDLLETFSTEVLDAERSGQPLVLVGRQPRRPDDAFLLQPYLRKGVANVLMGRYGEGKTTVAEGMVVQVETGVQVLPGTRAETAPTLLLDWESTQDDANERVALIAAGAGVEAPEIAYLPMIRPLADAVEDVAPHVIERGIGLVVVDSLGPAVGAGGDGDPKDAVLRFFAALRVLRTTSLVIAQVAGADVENTIPTAKAYGSIFTMYEARNVLELRREKEPTGDGRSELLLINTKVNRGAKLPPAGLAVVYGNDSIRFESATVEAPDLVQVLSVPEKMYRLLIRSGAQHDAFLAKALGTEESYIRSIISRDKRHRFSRLPDGRVGVASHA
jgi:hypothetical protein